MYFPGGAEDMRYRQIVVGRDEGCLSGVQHKIDLMYATTRSVADHHQIRIKLDHCTWDEFELER